MKVKNQGYPCFLLINDQTIMDGYIDKNFALPTQSPGPGREAESVLTSGVWPRVTLIMVLILHNFPRSHKIFLLNKSEQSKYGGPCLG